MAGKLAPTCHCYISSIVAHCIVQLVLLYAEANAAATGNGFSTTTHCASLSQGFSRFPKKANYLTFYRRGAPLKFGLIDSSDIVTRAGFLIYSRPTSRLLVL